MHSWWHCCKHLIHFISYVNECDRMTQNRTFFLFFLTFFCYKKIRMKFQMLFCKVLLLKMLQLFLSNDNGMMVLFPRILSGGFPQIYVNNAFYSLKELSNNSLLFFLQIFKVHFLWIAFFLLFSSQLKITVFFHKIFFSVIGGCE